jgi:hypothetical protein
MLYCKFLDDLDKNRAIWHRRGSPAVKTEFVDAVSGPFHTGYIPFGSISEQHILHI